MSLDTGRPLHGQSWTPCTPDQTGVKRVHALGRKQRMPEMTNGPIFEHRPRIPLRPSIDGSDSDFVSTQSCHHFTTEPT